MFPILDLESVLTWLYISRAHTYFWHITFTSNYQNFNYRTFWARPSHLYQWLNTFNTWGSRHVIGIITAFVTFAPLTTGLQYFLLNTVRMRSYVWQNKQYYYYRRTRPGQNTLKWSPSSHFIDNILPAAAAECACMIRTSWLFSSRNWRYNRCNESFMHRHYLYYTYS